MQERPGWRAYRSLAEGGGRRFLLCAALLVLVCAVAYANSFSAGFTLDNAPVILRDPRLRELSPENVRLVVTKSYWWPNWASNLYRPLTTLSYLVNWSVLGNASRPAGYHAVNLFLHAANVLLVFVLTRRLALLAGRAPGEADALALIAGAVFAAHPVGTEAVTNIVGRADLFAALAVLSGYYCHLRATASEVGPWTRVGWHGLSGLVGLLGVFAKESTVMLAAVLPLHHWIFAAGPEWSGAWRARLAGVARWSGGALARCLPLVPAIGALLIVRYLMFRGAAVYGEVFVDNPIAQAAPMQGWLTACKVLARYLGLLLWPATLSSDYSYNQIPLYGEAVSSWEDVQCWLGLAVLAGLVGLAMHLRRTWPLFALGALFFLVQLAPTSNLLRPIGSIMGERFLYVPMYGFCVAVAAPLAAAGRALARVLGDGGTTTVMVRWAPFALPAAVVVLLLIRTVARNADWRDDYSLWRSAASASPDSYKVHLGLAEALFERDPTEAGCDAAIVEAEVGLRVLDARPMPPERRDNTLFISLARHYLRKGDFRTAAGSPAEAARFYRTAVDILGRARELDQWVNARSRASRLTRGIPPEEIPDVGNWRIYVLLAAAHIGSQEWAEAIRAADYACHLSYAQPDCYSMLAIAHDRVGDGNAAAIAALQALMLRSDNPAVCAHLEEIALKMGITPSPVKRSGDRYQLDASHPRVRAWINEACRGLLERCCIGRGKEEFDQFRERALAQYACPPSVLPEWR